MLGALQFYQGYISPAVRVCVPIFALLALWVGFPLTDVKNVIRSLRRLDRAVRAYCASRCSAETRQRLPVPRSSEYPAFRRDHWAMGRPSIRN
jgi:hypothetical protein